MSYIHWPTNGQSLSLSLSLPLSLLYSNNHGLRISIKDFSDRLIMEADITLALDFMYPPEIIPVFYFWIDFHTNKEEYN